MYIRVPVLSHPRHNWRGKRITDTVIYLPFLIQKPPPWDNSNFKHSEGNRHGEELGEKNAVVSKRNDSWLLSAVRSFSLEHWAANAPERRDEIEPIIVVGCLGRNLRNS
jgi:hypothetical protein